MGFWDDFYKSGKDQSEWAPFKGGVGTMIVLFVIFLIANGFSVSLVIWTVVGIVASFVLNVLTIRYRIGKRYNK
ncbi:hypothetical protein [Salipaludibacillus aurantiacus]|uniref:Uncharacterized protein n=1 Tax=Salipaludibacillus aurantiacus TaxID=1601833 RepID=A0A1H9US97_9BACI|nr:hypothetical protein [Salipaludibacillus aurantiacus]SES12266.1 hypothetical protein SAMN05518684_108137 [Salipaludibacillus aurantiacus]